MNYIRNCNIAILIIDFRNYYLAFDYRIPHFSKGDKKPTNSRLMGFWLHSIYLSHIVFCETQRTIFTSARTTANTSATQNPSMTKPGTSFATRRTMRTLIMREKSPSVRILSGSVRILSMGTMIVFTIARTTATMTAVRYPSTCAPGVRYDAIATASPEMRRLRSTFMRKKVNKSKPHSPIFPPEFKEKSKTKMQYFSGRGSNYLDPLLKLVSILSPSLELRQSGDGYFPMRFRESHVLRHFLHDSHHLLDGTIRISEGTITITVWTILQLSVPSFSVPHFPGSCSMGIPQDWQCFHIGENKK